MTDKRRILFVDDEPLVLSGLRRLLWRFADEWEMCFVENGQDALALFAQQPFDVLVTDMRMPGMRGAELLRIVYERYPSTVRLVLSGHADREEVTLATGVAHQFLSKPCESALLQQVLTRACRLQALLDAPEVRALVAELSGLPTHPPTYVALQSILGGGARSRQQVAAQIEANPALAAEVLRLARIGDLTGTAPLASLEAAASRYGFDHLRSLVLFAEIFQFVGREAAAELSLRGVYAHSVRVARVSAALALWGGRGVADAFVAGLLHDIGLLVLIDRLPRYLGELHSEAIATGRPLCQLEFEARQATHSEIGAHFLSTLGLPYAIIEAAANHHMPERSAGYGLCVVTSVLLANRLVSGGTEFVHELSDELIEGLGIEGLTKAAAEQLAAAYGVADSLPV